MYAANWTYSTCILVLDILVWLRGNVLDLRLTDEDVCLLRGLNVDILT
jgi:hypothetical protein